MDSSPFNVNHEFVICLKPRYPPTFIFLDITILCSMSSQFELDTWRVAGSGHWFIAVAGEAITDRDAVRIGANGLIYQADADAVATMPCMGIAITAGAAGQNISMFIQGPVEIPGSAWTLGGKIYVSTVAGGLTQTAPAGVGDITQEVGVALNATQIYFNPQGEGTGIASGCAILEGATAYVGFDNCKGALVTNYFLCDGTADDVQMNLATTYVAALGGGSVELERGAFNNVATVNVPLDVMFMGQGYDTIINYNAGGNCITVTGDNVKIRDLKIDIVAGAGAGGTRPNCILADTRTNLEITKVWLVGDETVADDASDLRQCGIVFDTVTFSRVALCKINDHRRNGIFLSSSTNDLITGNTCDDNTADGIKLINSDYSITCQNTCNDNGGDGIDLNSTIFAQVLGNNCTDNSLNGIALVTASTDCTVTGNMCEGNSVYGSHIASASNIGMVTGNTCAGNASHGILLHTISGCTVVGNRCGINIRHGIMINGSSDNTVVGNTCNGNDRLDSGTYEGINITGTSLDNLVHSNTCNDNDRYGINIDDVNALRNWVKNNQLRGNTSGAFQDSGTNTKLAVKVFQFTEPLGTATYILTSPVGIEVDAADEGALACGEAPLEVQQVIRFRVKGVGLAAPGAGKGMLLEININAGKPTGHEAYNAEAIAVASVISTEDNFAVNDAVEWIIDRTDDADIADIAFGETIEMFSMFEDTGENGDIATDAMLRTISMEYV